MCIPWLIRVLITSPQFRLTTSLKKALLGVRAPPTVFQLILTCVTIRVYAHGERHRGLGKIVGKAPDFVLFVRMG
jgi:hypothetical protein